MTGRGIRRAAGPLAAAALLVAGCGVRPTGVIGAGAGPTATATSLPETTVYFLLHGRLHPVVRTVPPWDTQAVFDALLAGPTADERARGLRTALAGTDVTVRDLGAKGVFVFGGGRSVPPLAYAQVVCTTALLPNRTGTPLIAPSLGVKAALAAGCPNTTALLRLLGEGMGAAPPGPGSTGAASVAPVPAPTAGRAAPRGTARSLPPTAP